MVQFVAQFLGDPPSDAQPQNSDIMKQEAERVHSEIKVRFGRAQLAQFEELPEPPEWFEETYLIIAPEHAIRKQAMAEHDTP